VPPCPMVGLGYSIDKPEEIRVDSTGACLFLGRVTDPR
jgi:hypothetical protein